MYVCKCFSFLPTTNPIAETNTTPLPIALLVPGSDWTDVLPALSHAFSPPIRASMIGCKRNPSMGETTGRREIRSRPLIDGDGLKEGGDAYASPLFFFFFWACSQPPLVKHRNTYAGASKLTHPVQSSPVQSSLVRRKTKRRRRRRKKNQRTVPKKLWDPMKIENIPTW
jgi:hypothetical protein